MNADYSFYSGTYKGGLSEEEYASAAVKADAYLRQITMGRCARPDLPEAVRQSLQLAACALADRIALSEASGFAAGIASESNDGVSVSYRAHSEAEEEHDRYALVSAYIAWTGLLYRGMGGCTCCG